MKFNIKIFENFAIKMDISQDLGVVTNDIKILKKIIISTLNKLVGHRF